MPELNRPRVLIVDDDPLILDALERQLRARFAVTVASGGKEAMRRVNKPQIQEDQHDAREDSPR